MGHFNQALKDALKDVRAIEGDLTIGGVTRRVCSAPMTGEDIDFILRRHPEFHLKPTAAAIADLLIRKLRTEDGEPVFDAEDRVLLTKQPAAWLTSVRQKFIPDEGSLDDASIEDEEKNS